MDGGPDPAWAARGGFQLESDPGWSASLGGYGALVALFGTDTRGAFSVGGGTLRGRYSHYTLGGYYELTDRASGGGQWQAVGGMAGVWLPFRNWVDFEVAARVGVREFWDEDPRFGATGYKSSSPTLGLSLGVSDRAGHGLVAGRIGGGFVLSYDLSQRDEPWRYLIPTEDGDPIVRTGNAHIGGLSAALVLELMLDVAEQRL